MILGVLTLAIDRVSSKRGPGNDWKLQHALNWSVEEDTSHTFWTKFELCFSVFTTAKPPFLSCLCSLYVVWCIRVTKTNRILWNYGDWMRFSCHMISFHNHANHALFASNYLDSFWSDLAIIIRFDFHQNQIIKTIFDIFCYLFDLMWFLINKNQNKINKIEKIIYGFWFGSWTMSLTRYNP